MKFQVSGFKFLFLLFSVIIGINACRSSRKVSMPAIATVGDTVFYTSCYPIESLYVPSCKLEVSFGNQSFPLNGNIYIRPDSICYFGGKWLLFVLRGAIYRDSFVVVSIAERVCYKGKNDYLQKITGFPVNPESMMLLFTADRCEDTYRNKLNYIPAARSSEQILMQGNNRSLLEMNMNVNGHTIKNISLYNSSQRQALFSAAYTGYQQYRQFALPTVFDIAAYDGQTSIRIKASFQQVLFNQPQRVNITVPANYKVVVLE